MFGHRYFGARYFGVRYFGPGQSEPANLLPNPNNTYTGAARIRLYVGQARVRAL